MSTSVPKSGTNLTLDQRVKAALWAWEVLRVLAAKHGKTHEGAAAQRIMDLACNHALEEDSARRRS